MEIPQQIKDDIWDFCRVNNITNVDDFTLKLLKQGFTVEKFGATPITETVEKIVEKIIEVPVERIVEKIVEVPVTMMDTEISDAYKKLLIDFEKIKEEISKLKSANKLLVDELAVERKKNKKDIYGES